MKVTRLSESTREASSVGAKSASLASIFHTVAVPDGIVLPLAELSASIGLPGHLPGVLAMNEPGAIGSIAALVGESIGPGLCAEVGLLACPMVSVRSSFAFEDSARTALAGQFRSVVNVPGTDAEALCAAIAEVLWSLIDFHSRNHLSHFGLSADDPFQGGSILIQGMVDSAWSGVCFSRSPTGEQRSVVEFVEGLGDRLVGGEIRPHRIVALPATLAFIELQLERPLSPYVEQWGPLAGTLREVVKLAVKLEALFGSPQDVEWCLSRDGQLYTLQTRPVTALAVLSGDEGEPPWPAHGRKQ